MNPALSKLLSRHEKRMKAGKTFLLIFFGVFGLLVAAPLVISPEPFKLGVGIGMGAALFGCGCLVAALMTKNTKRAQQLFTEPHRIAWVYGVQQSVNGIPTAKPVHLLTLDGTEARIAAGNQIEVLLSLQRELPHAIFGYGPAQAAEFDCRAASM